MHPFLGGLSTACAVALQLNFFVVILQTPLPCPQFRTAPLITFARLYFHPSGSKVGVAEAWKPSPSVWGWQFLLRTVRGWPSIAMVIYISRENMNNKPDGHQTDILEPGKEATVGRAQTDFWLPPSSNAIGPELSRSATFKMPSMLLHREWIEQLTVRWLTPPVVDVLERGAYTSPLKQAARLANLPPPCRGAEACDPWAPAGPEIYQGGLNGFTSVTIDLSGNEIQSTSPNISPPVPSASSHSYTQSSIIITTKRESLTDRSEHISSGEKASNSSQAFRNSLGLRLHPRTCAPILLLGFLPGTNQPYSYVDPSGRCSVALERGDHHAAPRLCTVQLFQANSSNVIEVSSIVHRKRIIPDSGDQPHPFRGFDRWVHVDPDNHSRRASVASVINLGLPGCPSVQNGRNGFPTFESTVSSLRKDSPLSLYSLLLHDNILYFFGIAGLLIFNNLVPSIIAPGDLVPDWRRIVGLSDVFELR
ncbi:hypothetical protein B0H13DRAFT_1853497 [Mycena leptocephala]|nr:hypothetical protein B0H13DRAFT_1853497 [Mycena leptocephala]